MESSQMNIICPFSIFLLMDLWTLTICLISITITTTSFVTCWLLTPLFVGLLLPVCYSQSVLVHSSCFVDSISVEVSCVTQHVQKTASRWSLRYFKPSVPTVTLIYILCSNHWQLGISLCAGEHRLNNKQLC